MPREFNRTALNLLLIAKPQSKQITIENLLEVSQFSKFLKSMASFFTSQKKFTVHVGSEMAHRKAENPKRVRRKQRI